MKKYLLLAVAMISFLGTFAQEDDDCFKKLESAFAKRGSYTIADDMHRNVILSYFDANGSNCVSGKARVENGLIVSILIKYDDDTYEPMETKFYNVRKSPPAIVNGISEMIITPSGEKFRVVFIDNLKPKAKIAKTVKLPDDL